MGNDSVQQRHTDGTPAFLDLKPGCHGRAGERASFGDGTCNVRNGAGPVCSGSGLPESASPQMHRCRPRLRCLARALRVPNHGARRVTRFRLEGCVPWFHAGYRLIGALALQGEPVGNTAAACKIDRTARDSTKRRTVRLFPGRRRGQRGGAQDRRRYCHSPGVRPGYNHRLRLKNSSMPPATQRMISHSSG